MHIFYFIFVQFPVLGFGLDHYVSEPFDCDYGNVPSPLLSPLSSPEPVRHGGCWKLFHTDPGGQWYMPHKAGPITAFFLVLGWIIFLVLFGWIIGMALVLVFILVVFAYVLNFVCTGRCEIEEES